MRQLDANNVVVQMQQKGVMGVGLTTEQLNDISKHVLHGESLYPPITYNSSDYESDSGALKFPQELCFENNSNLIIRNSEKEEFYKLADRIIMNKMDEFIKRHHDQ